MKTRVWMLVLLCVACDDSGSDAVPEADASLAGTLGGPCYRNETCDDDLVCGPEDRCVEATDDTDAAVPDAAADVARPQDAAADTAPADVRIADRPVLPDAAQGCNEAAPCPGNQICLETGDCAEPEVCEADVDCFEGRECIDATCQAPCVEDADCPGTRSCVAGRCPEPEICAGPDDCDAPRRCVEGACLDPCADDEACADGEVCDLETGICRAEEQPECIEDADCPGSRSCVDGRCPEPDVCFGADDCDAGRACIEGACRAPCDGDEPCPGLQVCNQESGLCEESGECVGAVDCEGARVCAAEVCTDPCDGDDACPGTRSCDPVTRICGEAAFCVVAEDCDADRECVDGACVDTCVDARPCPGGLRCDQATGLCAEPDVCVEDAECRGARVCDGGACHAPCAADEECLGAQTCDVETGHCLVGDGCATDEDCPGLQLCGPAGACFLPDCEQNDDCDGACVDRQCAAGPPTACGPDAPCPGAQICTPLGACALAAACRDDVECAAATPRCDAFDGRCLECLGAADCAGAEHCERGRCVYDGDCDADEECPGDRVCRAGDCVPAPGCAGDRFDRDPAAAQLSLRTYTGLVLCDGDEDRFEIHVPADEGLRVVLRHAPGVGQLTATLRSADGGDALSRSGLGHGLEVVGVGPAEQPRDLVLVVTGRPGDTVSYALTLERLWWGACIPDALEGLLGNSVAGRATRIEAGEHRIELCPDEEDWFALDLPAGVRLSITASAIVEGDSATLILFAPDRERLAVAAQGDELTHDVLVPGLYLVQVESPAARVAVPLRLDVTVFTTEESEAQACAHPTALGLDGPAILPLYPALPRFGVSCAPDVDGDAVLRFVLETPALVSLQANGASAIAVRQECATLESERACRTGPDPALEALALDAGVWFVVLKAPGPERPTVSLTVRASCDDDDDCGAGVCDGGLCHPECMGDDDCPGAQTCRIDSGHCLEPARCADAADCLGARDCRHDGACFLPDCELNDDCEDGACVDRSCADVAPAECARDDDCRDALTCAPVGVCRLEGPCDADADCPPGAPVCAAASCVVCTGDAHCQAGETCEANRCIFRGVCEGPQDCPGERMCGEAGLCQPPDGCVGDRFDGRPEPASLTTRTYGGLLLCDGSTDRYAVQVDPGEGLRVLLRHDSAEGDLSLRIEGPPPLSDLLGESDGPLGVEVVQIAPEPMGGPRAILVQGRPGFATPYSITLERVDAGACTPDAFEGFDGNDDADHATALEQGVHGLTLCPEDEDWFALDLGAGTQLTVRATPAPARPLAVSMIDPGGEVVADAREDDDAWLLEADIAQAGRHLLRVRAPGQEEALAVELEVATAVGDNAEILACQNPLVLNPGQRVRFPAGQPVLRFAHSCGFGMRDYLASFDLAAPARVSLDTAGGTAVALRSTCANPASEFFCSFAGDPSLDDIALEAGTWYVVLQRLEEEPPDLLLTIR